MPCLLRSTAPQDRVITREPIEGRSGLYWATSPALPTDCLITGIVQGCPTNPAPVGHLRGEGGVSGGEVVGVVFQGLDPTSEVHQMDVNPPNQGEPMSTNCRLWSMN